MDRKQLMEWMDKVEQRLDKIEEILFDMGIKQIRDAAMSLEPKERASWRDVALAYREQYLKAKAGQVLDYPISKDRTIWEDLVQVVNGYAKPHEALDTALEGFFSDKWVIAHSYPPSALLKGFERFRCPPVIDQKDEPDPEAITAKRLRERRKEEQAALMQQLARDQEEAAPPPESLEEMVSRIGRGLK